MRRRKGGLIDMTPLLDVVFILLFALIINVNVTRAEDQAEMEEQVRQKEALSKEVEQLEDAYDQVANEKEAILASSDLEIMQVKEAHEETKAELAAQQERMDDFEAAMAETLHMNLEEETDASKRELIEALSSSDLVIQDWMKYKQIGDRYVFVEVRVSAETGNVYINDSFINVIITNEVARDEEAKEEAVNKLIGEMRHALTHEKGGGKFVFVSIVQDGQIYRRVEEAVKEALLEIQKEYDKEFYLIDKYKGDWDVK